MRKKNKCSVTTRGTRVMDEKEIELLNMIRTNENPERALVVAVEVIIDYLKSLERRESSQ